MIWALILACSCSGDADDDLRPPPRPATLQVEHDPAALVPYPNCVSYHQAVCEVCGANSDPCRTLRKVTDLCAQRGTCNEASCAAGEKRVRADPKGADSEMCTE
jgi:hypothetical protein